MIRKGLLSAAIAALTLGSAAYADDLATTPSLPQQCLGGSHFFERCISGSRHPELMDDQTAAPATPQRLPLPPSCRAGCRSRPPQAPLMWGLDQIGIAKPLENLNINIYGYVEAGYDWDFTHPKTPRPRAPPEFHPLRRRLPQRGHAQPA